MTGRGGWSHHRRVWCRRLAKNRFNNQACGAVTPAASAIFATALGREGNRVKSEGANSATIGSVKKLLLIFLLVALPFQFAWAAAAGYCDHEKPHPTHFGHHAHHHQAQAEKKDGKPKLSQIDSDCGYCHLSCQATPVPTLPAMNIREALAPPDFQPPTYYSFFPEGPQRPDIALVA